MAREVTTTTTLYTWDELSDAAKDHAREAHSRFLWEDGSANESMQMIFDDLMESEGWENCGDLSYSLDVQGGEPMWTGDIPQFHHGDRDWYVQVRKRRLGGSSYMWEVTVDEGDGAEDFVYDTPEWHRHSELVTAVEKAVKDHCRALSSRLYEAFVAEDEYMVADEQMAETSEANGYEYTEAGDLA